MTGNELKEKMAALPPITEPYPAHTWPRHQVSLRKHVANDDSYSFLGWSTVVATMFVGNGASFINDEYEALPYRYRRTLPEPHFGHPELLIIDGTVTSGNLVHQAYHLFQLEESLKVRIEELDSIVEFGGGYGAMVLLCRRLGFKGKYTIIDLPELSLLQKFYLSNTIGLDGVGFIDDYDFAKKKKADLFMGIYSISEIAPNSRLALLRNIKAANRFIAFQHTYTLSNGEQVDNVASFESLGKRFEMRCFRNEVMSGHWYCATNKD